MSQREQFDTFSVAGPVGRSSAITDALDSFGVERQTVEWAPGVVLREDVLLPGPDRVLLVDVDRRSRLMEAEPERGFDVAALPPGVGWASKYDPARGRVKVSASIPAAKRRRDGTLKTEGTTGIEGVSVYVGSWGTEEVEWATVQVSSKAMYDGDNVLPMQGEGETGLAFALDNFVGPVMHKLGYRGKLDDLAVPRFDAVVDFTEVEAHGRYVAAFGENKPPVRGGRHVMHADETLAMHFAHGMTRFYNKGRESPGNPLAARRSRFEFEMKRDRLKRLGMENVRSLDLARIDRKARAMFEECGYDNDVAPVADWVWKLMSAVPRYPECEFCAGTLAAEARDVHFDLAMAVELGGLWGDIITSRTRVTQCLDPDRCGQEMSGFSAASRRGAMAHAILKRAGLPDELIGTHRNTLSKYNKLYEEAGVVPDSITEIFENGDGADVVYLDLESQTERRKPRRAS